MQKESSSSRAKRIFLFELNIQNIVGILCCILLNMVGQRFAEWLKLPFWLDTIGTMACAIALGPLAGMIVGGLTNVILSIVNPTLLVYVIISVLVGLLTGYYFANKKRSRLETVTAGVILAFVVVLFSFPLDIVNFDGQTGNIWGDAFYDMMSEVVSSEIMNALGAKLFLEIPDKVLSVLLATLLVKLVRKFSSRGSKGEGSGKKGTGSGRNERKKKQITAILLLAAALGTVFSPMAGNVYAEEQEEDYEAVIYKNGDGIQAAEINAVAQTPDGYIWAGTYSGLYIYDGIRFSKYMIDARIRNVMALFVDSSGRLWIGTNDSGAVCYNPKTEEEQMYNTENGLTADSIREFCEDKDGNVYIATSRYISRVSPDGEVKSYSDWEDIFYAQSFITLDTGEIVGITNGGVMFLLNDDQLLDTNIMEGDSGIYYRSVSSAGGEILVGCSDSTMRAFSVKNGKFVPEEVFTLPGLSFTNDMTYSPEYHGIFICGENGMGLLDEETHEYKDFTDESVNGAVSDVCVDDQKNIWFASSKYGLIKYSRSPFLNVFNRAKLEKSVVNAVYKDGDNLYIGTDTGLHILDLNTYQEEKPSYLSQFENVRVRNIYKDSKGNIWFSTYGEDGLIRVDPSGKTMPFNDQSGGMLGGRCRCVIELSDGRILAASNMGLSFIKGDQVVTKIGVDNGLDNQYILSMYEREDGSILAASDGDGIYIIKDDRVTGHIGKEEGLETAVVLKIVKCTGGYLYVTSNSLYYDNGSSIRQLVHFPYSNCYDIMITEDHMCWITSSAGLFFIKEDLLLEDGEYNCTLLDESWGLTTTFTANSFSQREQDLLYLCCTDGVRVISTKNYDSLGSDFQMHISSVELGNMEFRETNGKYVIPAGGGRVTFNVAVNNYSLSNPLVHYYLEGTDDEGLTLYQNEIQPLSFTNLPHGEYKFHICILDSSSGVVRVERTFDVIKESRMYERLYFRIYLYILSVLIVMYIVWVIIAVNRNARRMIGLQKEVSTDKMTGLLNKAGASRALEKACSEVTGVFLMIDLDSFKLVNDIHGHDMGDKILIRFAELIRQALGEGNIAGRIGGDEFVGFLKGEIDEDRVGEITRGLNRELVKSAKEYMGEDMNIPIGTSIGAVRVPEEGTDYHEIFKLADKALYVVKQNGKHSYSFYQSSGGEKEAGKGKKDKNSLAEMKQIIGERNEGKGAYLVNFDRLQALYKYVSRNDHATDSDSGFLRFSIRTEDGQEVSDAVLDSFEDHLVTGLKKNDVISRYSGSFFTLCVGVKKEECRKLADDLILEWKKSGDYQAYDVQYELEMVG